MRARREVAVALRGGLFRQFWRAVIITRSCCRCTCRREPATRRCPRPAACSAALCPGLGARQPRQCCPRLLAAGCSLPPCQRGQALRRCRVAALQAAAGSRRVSALQAGPAGCCRGGAGCCASGAAQWRGHLLPPGWNALGGAGGMASRVHRCSTGTRQAPASCLGLAGQEKCCRLLQVHCSRGRSSTHQSRSLAPPE